ncbi:unnamed protein product [Trichogramma brassicae]|uniref:Uncharacterized protein n=1 Tax=Trichogramma brassicae TaxID=86971 RepID=A0A6H5J8E0_9HYME|nr:unnamed protein product [Trichogramma brassicae]
MNLYDDNLYDDRCATFGITEKCEDCQLRVMRMNLYDDRCATFGITEKCEDCQVTAGDAYELVLVRSVCDFRPTEKSARTARLRQVMRMNSYDYRCATSGITEKVRDCQLRQVMRMNLYDDRASQLRQVMRMNLYDDRCATFARIVRQVMRMNLYDDRCATFGITEKVREDCQLRQVMRMNCTTIGVRLSALRKKVRTVRRSDAYELVRLRCATFGIRKKCEDCQLRQVMRMNLYDDRCATFSALRKKCEDCQLRQVMRMNSYDDRCATFGITEKVRGLPVTASDAYELVRRSVCDFRHYGKMRGLPVTASDAYELVRRSVCDFRHTEKCEDCQLRQVMRMNLYDDRCATFGVTEKVR